MLRKNLPALIFQIHFHLTRNYKIGSKLANMQKPKTKLERTKERERERERERESERDRESKFIPACESKVQRRIIKIIKDNQNHNEFRKNKCIKK